MKKQDASPLRLSRRQLAGAVLATVAAAQTPPASAPADAAGELQSARDANRQTAEALAKVDVPITMEPAFHFTV